jgi:hypothetical protein
MTSMMMALVWLAAGGLAGVAHAAGLWRGAHARRAASLSVAGRMTVVAIVLTAAAVGQHLLAAVGGWLAGLVVTSVVLYLGREQ